MDSIEILDWALFACLGRLLIYLWLENPISNILRKITFFNKMFDCLLCTGVWAYWILAIIFNVEIVPLENDYVFGEFITGTVTSFFVYVFEAGWKTLFTSVVIVPESDE